MRKFFKWFLIIWVWLLVIVGVFGVISGAIEMLNIGLESEKWFYFFSILMIPFLGLACGGIVTFIITTLFKMLAGTKSI